MVQFLEMHTERVRRVVAFRRIPHTDENAFAGERVRRADIGRLELEKALEKRRDLIADTVGVRLRLPSPGDELASHQRPDGRTGCQRIEQYDLGGSVSRKTGLDAELCGGGKRTRTGAGAGAHAP